MHPLLATIMRFDQLHQNKILMDTFGLLHEKRPELLRNRRGFRKYRKSSYELIRVILFLFIIFFTVPGNCQPLIADFCLPTAYCRLQTAAAAASLSTATC
jgi:hypothetical protein